MSKRRSRLEIYLSILSTVKDGVDKPTRIMYAANMSWKPTQRMLSHLVKQGLILEVPSTKGRQSRRLYKITDKGEKVLDYFDRSNELLVSSRAFPRRLTSKIFRSRASLSGFEYTSSYCRIESSPFVCEVQTAEPAQPIARARPSCFNARAVNESV